MSDPTPNETTTNETQDQGSLPQWARDQITEANAQAAKYRVEKNDAVEAAKSEVENEWKSKYEALEAQIADKDTEVNSSRTEVAKLKAALEAGIDSDKVVSFAALLQGSTEDELRSHADEVKSLFTTSAAPAGNPPAQDPSQGSGNPLPLNGDPLLDAVMGIVNK